AEWRRHHQGLCRLGRSDPRARGGDAMTLRERYERAGRAVYEYVTAAESVEEVFRDYPEAARKFITLREGLRSDYRRAREYAAESVDYSDGPMMKVATEYMESTAATAAEMDRAIRRFVANT